MLKQQIQKDTTEALKSGDNFTAGVLRMVLAFIITKEKDKRYKISKLKPELKEEDLIKESELTDEETIDVIFSEIKKRKDAIVLYEKGGRQELADKEKALKDLETLQRSYLTKIELANKNRVEDIKSLNGAMKEKGYTPSVDPKKGILYATKSTKTIDGLKIERYAVEIPITKSTNNIVKFKDGGGYAYVGNGIVEIDDLSIAMSKINKAENAPVAKLVVDPTRKVTDLVIKGKGGKETIFRVIKGKVTCIQNC